MTSTASSAAFPCNRMMQTQILRSTPLCNAAWPKKTYFVGRSVTSSSPWVVFNTSHLDVDINPDLPVAEYNALRQAGADFPSVFDAAKGSLPALADHPLVDLNFKPTWKHASVPIPKWGPGATAVLTRWAKEMLDCGLYAKSKSPSTSRPHIVRKPPPTPPKMLI